jgi:hypothetical protein
MVKASCQEEPSMTRNMPVSRAAAASPLSRGGIVAPLSLIPTGGKCGVSLAVPVTTDFVD